MRVVSLVFLVPVGGFFQPLVPEQGTGPCPVPYPLPHPPDAASELWET